MSLKKKLGAGVVSAALGLSLIGGGTYAYFGVVPAKLSPPAIRKCQDYYKLLKFNTFNTNTPVLVWMGVT